MIYKAPKSQKESRMYLVHMPS